MKSGSYSTQLVINAAKVLHQTADIFYCQDQLDHIKAAFLENYISDHGYGDLAFTLLNQDSCPSWLYPVKQGATTIWEK